MNGGMCLKPGISLGDFLANITSTSLQVASQYHQGKRVSFVELELGLWEKLREVIRENMNYHKFESPRLNHVPRAEERLESWAECK